MEKENIYLTRNLVLAAILIRLHFNLLEIDYRTESNQTVGYFKFEETEALQEIIKKHLSNSLNVEPKQLMGNIRDLKAQINTFCKSPDSDFYLTQDIVLATTLVTLDFKLIKIDYQLEGFKKRPVGYFNFNNTQELQTAIIQYLNGDLSVNSKQYMNNVRELKIQINDFYRNPKSKI